MVAADRATVRNQQRHVAPSSCEARFVADHRPACVDGDGVEARVILEGVRRAETHIRRAESLWIPSAASPRLDAEATVQ